MIEAAHGGTILEARGPNLLHDAAFESPLALAVELVADSLPIIRDALELQIHPYPGRLFPLRVRLARVAADWPTVCVQESCHVRQRRHGERMDTAQARKGLPPQAWEWRPGRGTGAGLDCHPAR